jgi:hypothetical protein
MAGRSTFNSITRHGNAPDVDLDQACAPRSRRAADLADDCASQRFDLNQPPDESAAVNCRRQVSPGVVAMPEWIDDLLPTAQEIQKQAALNEAEKADEFTRRLAAAEAEKQKLIEKLSKPSGLSEDEKVKLASTVIQRAVRNGMSEVQVYRFPNSLCTDRGRAINQMEAGWEKTLTGMAKEIYQLWADYLQPRGYRIRYQIVDFPGGVPGDISIVISWGD